MSMGLKPRTTLSWKTSQRKLARMLVTDFTVEPGSCEIGVLAAQPQTEETN